MLLTASFSATAMLLENRTAIITGNPYGIGRAAAQLLTAHGATVVCLDDTSEGWRDSADEGFAPPLILDVSDAEALEAISTECASILGHLDILVNLAGRVLAESFEATQRRTWDWMFARNVTATYLCSQAFLPLMKRGPRGSIVNHSSIDGLLGNPSLAAYSAAKGALLPLTHVMAHDLARYGIRANCVSTGGIRDGEVRAKDVSLSALTPAGRMGTPQDVAQVILFLASDLSSYVNGANIVVDGGRTVITQGCYTS